MTKTAMVLLDRIPDDQRVLEALLRTHLSAFARKVFHHLEPNTAFQENWHIALICDHLERVRHGETTRLIINLPPRHLKSILVSVALPAFLLGHDPAFRIIIASYGAELAEKHARDALSVMQSDWYRRLFPGTRLSSSRPAASDFRTTKAGGVLAVSTGGPITGRGANLIIIDDPLKAAAAKSDAERDRTNSWFDENILQRLDDKTAGAVIVVMQRLHDEDLTGYLLEKGGWVHLRLAAIAEKDERHVLADGRVYTRKTGGALHTAREPLESLLALKRELGSYSFAGQYQQDPAPREGGLVRPEWFPRSSADGVKFDMVIQSWDTAHKADAHNDYSVCTTWGRSPDDRFYLLDLFRAKLEFPQLVARVASLHDQHQPYTILVEDSASGTSLIQSLRQSSRLPIKAVRPEGDKATRLILLTGLIESGHVILPPEAPWLDDFLLEITRFPNAKHDDQVDSFTQGLTYLRGAVRHQFW